MYVAPPMRIDVWSMARVLRTAAVSVFIIMIISKKNIKKK